MHGETITFLKIEILGFKAGDTDVCTVVDSQDWL
jgi:hypothetical protein